MNMTPEPVIGRIASGGRDEPSLDFDGPEPSTEEAFFDTTEVAKPFRTESDEVSEWEERGSRTRKVLFLASGLAAIAAVFALLTLAAWVQWIGPAWRGHAATVDGPDITEIVGAPTGDLVLEHPGPAVPEGAPIDGGTDGVPVDDDVENAPPVPGEDGEPVPSPSTTPAARPVADPVEPPRPAPSPRATAPSRSTLIARGWDSVESDPATARDAFGKVLAENADDHEAAYGYGYALLEQGDPAAAAPYLCRARPSPDVTIQREVDGLLVRHAITCP